MYLINYIIIFLRICQADGRHPGADFLEQLLFFFIASNQGEKGAFYMMVLAFMRSSGQ